MFNFLKKTNSSDPFAFYNSTRLRRQRYRLCHAPFLSLLFTPSGDVNVCHYNRGFVAGRYPEQSIAEIWDSAAINEIRQALLKNDLSYGCFLCEKNILLRNSWSVAARKYDYLTEYKQKGHYPVMLDFQISNECNLKCLMCSGEYSSNIQKNIERSSNRKNVYDDNFISQVLEISPFISVASFTGGEPFVISLYHRLWELMPLLNPNLRINVSTNATVLNDRLKTILNKGNFNFTVSIDSMDKSVYEKIRRNAKIEKTLQNIDYIENYCKEKQTFFSIKCCFMTHNWESFPHLYQHWNERNVFLNPKAVWYPPASSVRYLPQNEIEKIISYLKNFSFTNKTEVQQQNNRRYEELIKLLEVWKNEAAVYRISERIQQDATLLQDELIRKCSSDFDTTLVERLTRLLNQLNATLGNDKKYKLLLINLLCLPTEMLKAELKRRSDDAIFERLKQASENYL